MLAGAGGNPVDPGQDYEEAPPSGRGFFICGEGRAQPMGYSVRPRGVLGLSLIHI